MNRALLRLASLLVPSGDRAEWLAEWCAELCFVPRSKATAFCLGAFRDALWLRRHDETPPRVWLQSPWHCLTLLAIAAALSLAFYSPSKAIGNQWVAYPVILLVSAALLPAVADVSLGEFPAKPRWWLFLIGKIVLVIPIVLFGTIDLMSFVARVVAPHGIMVGAVIGFRWVLTDQRHRCPVCLRLVVRPLTFGAASRTLLDWYGTELVCAQGHGCMHLPEIHASYCRPRFIHL